MGALCLFDSNIDFVFFLNVTNVDLLSQFYTDAHYAVDVVSMFELSEAHLCLAETNKQKK